jgi:hypothetical protein
MRIDCHTPKKIRTSAATAMMHNSVTAVNIVGTVRVGEFGGFAKFGRFFQNCKIRPVFESFANFVDARYDHLETQIVCQHL